MNEAEIRRNLLAVRDALREARRDLLTTSKAIMDPNERQHTQRSLAGIELALKEIAAALWPHGEPPSER